MVINYHIIITGKHGLNIVVNYHIINNERHGLNEIQNPIQNTRIRSY